MTPPTITSSPAGLPMPDYWLDSDSLIDSSKRFYHPDIVPGFWTFVEQKADEGVIASCLRVYEELQNVQDELSKWATKVNARGFFVAPDPSVQAAFGEIADHVKNNYSDHNASEFLDGADPWLIAHARVHGGEIVTQEVSAPHGKKPKVPDVGAKFGVKTLTIWQLLRRLGASFG